MPRYILEFPTEFGIESYYVSTSNRPRLAGKTQPIRLLLELKGCFNERFNIIFVDSIGSFNYQGLLHWLQLCQHYKPYCGHNSIGYKKNFKMIQIDPCGCIVEEFFLLGVVPFLKTNLPTELNNLSDLKFELYYDRVK